MSKIDLKINEKIAKLHFKNEKKKNALDRNDLEKITEFLKKIKYKNLNCLTITSSGNTFSAGMNFNEFSVGNWEKNPISEVCDLIENLPFITICLIDGGVYGGSVELAISADFRIGSKNCKIYIPASKYGIHYGYKGIKRCIDFFGLQVSKKLLLLGDTLHFNDLKKNNFLDYYDEDIKNSEDIFNQKIKHLSLLSQDSIKKMKASINDYKNNDLNLEIEKSRFMSSFNNELLLKKISKLEGK